MLFVVGPDGPDGLVPLGVGVGLVLALADVVSLGDAVGLPAGVDVCGLLESIGHACAVLEDPMGPGVGEGRRGAWLGVDPAGVDLTGGRLDSGGRTAVTSVTTGRPLSVTVAAPSR